MLVSPKSIMSPTRFVSSGGEEKSMRRWAMSSVNTPPAMLSDGPRDSMSALSVMRLTLECRGMRSSSLTTSARRNQCPVGSCCRRSWRPVESAGEEAVLWRLRTYISKRGVSAVVRRGEGTDVSTCMVGRDFS